MVLGLVITTSGKIKEITVKGKESEFYKLVNLKKPDGFELKHNWPVELEKKYNVYMYGKTEGKAGTENKFEFPPPIDQELFFGSCLLVNKKNDELYNLTSENWEDIYNYLYGGFEDLDDEEDDEEDDEDDEEDEVELTKEGYKKDDFIVDDDVSDTDDDDEEEEDEDSEETFSTSESDEPDEESMSDGSEEINIKKKSTKNNKKKKVIKTNEELSKEELECIDISGELEEEEYV